MIDDYQRMRYAAVKEMQVAQRAPRTPSVQQARRVSRRGPRILLASVVSVVLVSLSPGLLVATLAGSGARGTPGAAAEPAAVPSATLLQKPAASAAPVAAGGGIGRADHRRQGGAGGAYRRLDGGCVRGDAAGHRRSARCLATGQDRRVAPLTYGRTGDPDPLRWHRWPVLLVR
jgi:hypothetical protein